ncbi:MAG TPA: cobalt-precorrin-5B (C(1))-methyltransferase CbiD [Candidatus Dormibacteraeota bacterium]|nr:cobalt-precorrin-5B (C(1))-methyltransferase CbiD [Candidatus Dormibacteraeota bacterium]
MYSRPKTGFTTGACAAAAAKAATLAFSSGPVGAVMIKCPTGEKIEIPIEKCEVVGPGTAQASVVKNSGDDAKYDITHGMKIFAAVSLHNGAGIIVKGGEGIGIVTKPGLQVAIGEPAINPVPMKMIIESVKEVIPSNMSAEVVISVPDGTKVANRTYNPKLGIVGGISILGTTGIVRPRSLSAFVASIVAQIDVAVAQRHERLILVPGSIGERITKQLLETSPDEIIQTGDFIGYMIKKAAEKGVKEIIIVGHAGKLVKLAAGIFNTNYRVADARREIVSAYAAMAGAPKNVIEMLMHANTTDEMADTLERFKLSEETFNLIANSVRERVVQKTGGKVKANIVIVSYNGRVLGTDSDARGLPIWRRSS